MYEVQHIRVRSLGKLVMLLSSGVYIVFGLAVTLLYGSIRSVFIGEFFPNSATALTFFLVWMAGLVAVLPLTYLIGVLCAAFYNLFARWWGGLRIDLARVESVQGPSVVQTPVKKDEKKEKHHA